MYILLLEFLVLHPLGNGHRSPETEGLCKEGIPRSVRIDTGKGVEHSIATQTLLERVHGGIGFQGEVLQAGTQGFAPEKKGAVAAGQLQHRNGTVVRLRRYAEAAAGVAKYNGAGITVPQTQSADRQFTHKRIEVSLLALVQEIRGILCNYPDPGSGSLEHIFVSRV